MDKVFDRNRIAIERLCYSYPGQETPALSGIDLEFKRGNMYALLGRNGSGKSTLARCMNALLEPSSGKVVSCGLDSALPDNGPEICRRVAMVFQNPDTQLVGTSVEEEVAFGPENIGLSPELIRERVDRALEMTGLTGDRNAQPQRLSQGRKQLVTLAGALAMDPVFLVSDESTSMLDHSSRARVMELFGSLTDNGVGVIHVTHFIEEALGADRVVVLEEGRVAAEGRPRDVLSDPDRVRSLGLNPLPVTSVVREMAALGRPVERKMITVEELIRWALG